MGSWRLRILRSSHAVVGCAVALALGRQYACHAVACRRESMERMTLAQEARWGDEAGNGAHAASVSVQYSTNTMCAIL